MSDESNILSDNLRKAVNDIKSAILNSQYRAAKLITGEQLSLYYGIGAYVSSISREGTWGTGTIERISEQLRRELPGLRGYSAESIKKMRTFYEYWKPYINQSPQATDLQIVNNEGVIDIDRFALQKWSPLATEINREEFLSISFSHHMEILHKKKDLNEVLFYIHETVMHKWDKYDLRDRLKQDLYKNQGSATNNFLQTLPVAYARKAVGMFKDEYLLDFINVEEVEVTNPDDVDERVVEQTIVRNIKKFIMTFGRDFAYIGQSVSFGDLLRRTIPRFTILQSRVELHGGCGVKTGKFKAGYLGQLQAYMRVLDDKVRKPHENPTIGILLCKTADKAFVEYTSYETITALWV